MLIMIIQDVQVPQMIFSSSCQDTKCVLFAELAGIACCSVCEHTAPPSSSTAQGCLCTQACAQHRGTDLKGKPLSLFSESHLTLTPSYSYAKQVVNPLSIWVQCYKLSISQGHIMEKLGKFLDYCLVLGIYLSGLSIYHYLSWWSPGVCKRSLKNCLCFSSCINCQQPLQLAGEVWAWLHLGQG